MATSCVGVTPCGMGFWASPRSAGISIINDVVLKEKWPKIMDGGLYKCQEC